MRLLYITRVKVPSKDAQSRQIANMSRAYHEAMGEDFLLLCGGSDLGAPDVPHRVISRASRQWQRYFWACVRAAGVALGSPRLTVITRDIAVAWTLVALGGRVVFEAHDIPRGRVAEALLRRCIGSPRFRMVTNCHALADFYRDQRGMPAERLLALHNGCFVDEYDALRHTDRAALRQGLGLPADKLVIVHTGSLYKGGAELFEHAAAWRPGATEFVHIGGSAAECERWTRHYEARGLRNLRFLPHQPPQEVRRFQRAADLLFFVSTRNSSIWWCTSPLKVFEYMASGTPILGAALGSLGEVLNPGNAFLYDPDRPASITEALDAFGADAQAAAARAQAALAEARDQYAWQRRARRILAFAQVLPPLPGDAAVPRQPSSSA